MKTVIYILLGNFNNFLQYESYKNTKLVFQVICKRFFTVPSQWMYENLSNITTESKQGSKSHKRPSKATIHASGRDLGTRSLGHELFDNKLRVVTPYF